MKIHYLQHVTFEGLGCIAEWAQTRAYPVTSSRVYTDSLFPEMDRFDVLFVMGGPMSVSEENRYSWMKEEKRFIESAVRAGKYIVAICLGAQLVADVLGARVYRNKNKEIGWFPIQWYDRSTESGLFRSVPDRLEVFHWHGETFELPDGAVHLAYNDTCRNQAFLLNNRILAFQFHMEMTAHGIEQLMHNCAHELVQDRYIQNEAVIRSGFTRCPQLHGYFYDILDRLTNDTNTRLIP